jgi:type IV pilus assembly protein PilA
VITTLRKRIESEKGFTLIEMLIVIIILGILLAIAVPAYLKFRDRANEGAAQANIRAMIPAVEAYNADNSGYANMAIGGATGLQTVYDAALKGPPAVTILSSGAAAYCIKSVSGGKTYYKTQATDISTTACT